MAIDFLIFGLLLISISINLLALGAFWVTPGLRTTANRFVINLLIVNIIGCLILGPTLFLTGNYRLSYTTIIDTQKSSSTSSLLSSASSMTAQATTAPTTSDLLKLQIKSSYSDTNSSNNAALTTTLKTTTYKTETLFKCNKSKCEEITVENDETSETIVITEMEIDNINSNNNNNNDNNNNENNIKNSQQPSETYTIKTSKRCWSLDLAAALGALSVLLVVGDTWCAVTDPLRYHSRISGLKSWIMIAITWIISIFFGILSAIRDNAFNTIIFNSNNINNNNNAEYNTIKTLQPNELYNMIYSAFYFIVIILLPFGFVCGMYWRIFSEARENGLRMRQNGSSPLLQSALNLSSAAGCNQQHQNNICKDTITTGGLTLKIDRRRSSDREAIKPLLVHVPVHNNNINNNNNRILPQKQISNDSKVPLQQQHQHDHDDHDRQTLKQDRNQNIVLTLSAANEEIRRNFSARQLSVLGSSFDDITDNKQANKNAIRQVQSTPNLKDYQSQTLNGIDHSHNALQLPTIQASPKALSYMTSIRHRLSNASSLFKYREESRAARISILVVIMFLISYLPYGLLVLLQGRLTNLFSNSTQIAICMVLMGNISSPFIFAYRNKRVRRGVKRLFGLDKRSRERQMNRNSISAGLLRAGTKASINVRRSASKASTYSVNSCKFLTPHAVNNGTFLMEIEKCHYLKSDCPNPKDAIIIHPEKRSILKIVCDSSRKLGCAANSCANSDNEQTDV